MKRTKNSEPFPPEALTELALSGLRRSMFVVALNLNIFSKLAKKKVTLRNFAQLAGLPLPSARVLAQNLTNMNLLIYKNGKLSNSRLAQFSLTGDSVMSDHLLWLADAVSDPQKLLLQLRYPQKQPWYQMKEEKKKLSFFRTQRLDIAFFQDPNNIRVRWGKELAHKFNFSSFHHLVDVGGASGGWAIGILEEYPNLKATVFEQPSVAAITEQVLKTKGSISKRIQVMSGDFFVDKLPDCDVVLLANILHDWSLEDGKRLLRQILKTVPHRTAILIHEFFFEDDWTHANNGAQESVLVLGPKGKSGWQPSYKEMEELVNSVGYKRITRKKNLVIAYTP